MSDVATERKSFQADDPMRVVLLVEYCGTGFHGSQLQPGRPTVQQAVEEALRRLNLSTSAVSFASRTDTGVHARGQVAHVDISRQALANVPDLSAALNAVLPDTVAVRGVRMDAGLAFHSRREARAKWYRYEIHNAPYRSVWTHQAAHVRPHLDEAAMDQAALLMMGRHDFESFKCPDTDVTDNVCTVHYASVRRDGERVVFDIVADRFLYKMVRNLTGQLIAIGKGHCPPESIRSVMARRDRQAAAPTAKPEGLTLMAIRYEPTYQFFADDALVQTLNSLFNQPNPMESNRHENLFRKAS